MLAPEREKQELKIAANCEFRWIFGPHARKLHISIFGPHAHRTHDDHEKRLKQCENERLCFFSKKCAQKQDQNEKFRPFCLKTCEIAIAFRTPQKDHTQARFKIRSLFEYRISCMKSKESITSHFGFTIFFRRFCAMTMHKKCESLKKEKIVKSL